MPRMEPMELSTRDAFLMQARARLEEVREMEAAVNERRKTAPDLVQEDLQICAVDIDMYINLAEVEIDKVEHAREEDWIGMRPGVDTAIGNAQRELERAHEILSNPYAYVRTPENFPRHV
jgi:hypothetical protein